MAKRKTNIECIRDIMNYSAHGALIQAFVMQALTEYSNQVMAAKIEDLDTGLISGAAWQGCAREVRDAIEKHFHE